MAGNAVRRPLPALISLAALLLLTALVWWRVISRDTGSDAQAQGKHCTTSTTSTTPTASPTVTLPAQATVRVVVLNATSRTGLAGKTRATFITDGFAATAPPANYTGKMKITGVGQIRYPTSSRTAARLIGFYVPGATLVMTKKKSGPVIVVLGPRFRAVRTTTAAGAALATHRVAVSPAPASTTPSPGRTPSGSATSPSPSPTSTHC